MASIKVPVKVQVDALEEAEKLIEENCNEIYNKAIDDCYNNVLELCNYLIKIHNRDFKNAKSDKYKYDLSRDARTMNRDFNMTLDSILELKK